MKLVPVTSVFSSRLFSSVRSCSLLRDLHSQERSLFPAAAISLLSWARLGFLAACIVEQPRLAHHVASLLEPGSLSLQTPLRWHGHLGDEPAMLPGGCRLEIDLSGVAFEGANIPVEVALRVSFTRHPEDALLRCLPRRQKQRQCWRRYQIKTRTLRSNKKPRAACHS